MEEFELYYARLELCAYTYLLDRLSEKKISPGSLKVAIVSGDFTRVTEHNHVLYNISQESRLSSQIYVKGYSIFLLSYPLILRPEKNFLSNFWNA